MTSFTSGPWRATTGVLVRVVSPDGSIICGVHKQGRFTGEHDPEETIANARLIAAAPDLLENLRHAVAIIRKYVPADALGMNSQGGGDGWNDHSWPILDEYLHGMDAAIAKATGSQP